MNNAHTKISTPTTAETIAKLRTQLQHATPENKAFIYGAIDALSDIDSRFEHRKSTENQYKSYMAGWCKVHGL